MQPQPLAALPGGGGGFVPRGTRLARGPGWPSWPGGGLVGESAGLTPQFIPMALGGSIPSPLCQLATADQPT
jgi:hypothetical protein